MILADTDVLIDFLRDRAPMADRVGLELRARALATTSVSAFELRSGVRSERQRQAIEDLLGALPIFSFGPEEARLAAQTRLALEPQGQGIGMADYLIAGICLFRRAILLTRNRRHFERVPDLVLSPSPGSG